MLYMRTLLYAAIITAAAFVSGCATTSRINALKPEPSANAPVVYQSSTSFINLPVTVGLADIESQVNKIMTGLIYEDNNLEDDKIMMKVWKTAPIKLTDNNGKLQSIVPIKITANVKYGTSALGMDLYDTREFNMDAVVTFNSTVSMSNWKMATTTTLESLKWQESPTITIAGKKVAITYLINPAVKIFKSKIETKLDQAIAKTTDFKPQVLDAMEKLSTPFLTSEQYEAWFKLNPLELYVTDAVLSKKQITMAMGLKCTIQTIVGQKPKNNFKKEDVTLTAVSKMPDKINAMVAAISTYESASKVITKNFHGQEFGSGKRKVTVQKVDLWNKDGKMIIALDMTGSINGTIYLSGFPNYNPVTKEIYFDQMDYILNTKSVLMKTANWLAEGIILKKIQESCRYSIKDNLEEGKKNLLPYLKNYSPMPGIFVNGTLNDFEFDKVELTNNAIIAFIKTSGTMDVKIDGLK
jgi:type IV pilus biogenesis protein CpaD/CtpE